MLGQVGHEQHIRVTEQVTANSDIVVLVMLIPERCKITRKRRSSECRLFAAQVRKKPSDGDPNSTEEFKRFELHEHKRETVHCHYGSSPFVKGNHRCAYEFKHKQQKIAQRKNCSLVLPPRTTTQRKRSDAECDENSDWRVSEHEASTTSASIG